MPLLWSEAKPVREHSHHWLGAVFPALPWVVGLAVQGLQRSQGSQCPQRSETPVKLTKTIVMEPIAHNCLAALNFLAVVA